MVKSVLRIILSGSTGAGKSASGNVILGRTAFGSEKGSEFVTKFCQEESCTIDGTNVSVLDTPDVFNKSGQEIDFEIKRLKDYIAAGPCVILLVIRLDRIEDSLTVMEKYEELFGEECFGNGLILFTTDNQTGSNVENWKNKYPKLLTALKKYGNRYHVISNCTNFENRHQVKDLLLKIESTLALRAGNSTKAIGNNKMKNKMEKDSHLCERRILLLGKTGVGKSATGNTILCRDVFDSASDFSTVTRQCQKGREVVVEYDVTVVDTPDFFYTTHATETQDVSSEIRKSLALCTPGAHALLLVFPMGTFTEQENDVVELFKKGFGKAATQYTIVVFTHGDALCSTTMEKLIEKNENVRDLLHQCGGRYHILNNKERNNLCQVTELLEKVDKMVSDNGGSIYTVDMFHEAVAMHKEEWERMLKEMEEENRPEKHQQELNIVRDTEEGVGHETEERNVKEIKKRVMKEEVMKMELEEETRRQTCTGAPTRKWVVMVVLSGVVGGIVGILGGQVGIIVGATAGILVAVGAAHMKYNRKGNKKNEKEKM